MIISHKLRLILIKTKKVGGTSLEIALSRYCGPDDVITPVSPEDEALRARLGYRPAQNYLRHNNPNYTRWAPRNLVFKNHLSAAKIRSCIDPDVWNRYLKIAIVRNPFDALISRYYWDQSRDEADLDFEDFIAQNPEFLTVNMEIAPPAMIDCFLKYESFNDSLARLEASLGIDGLVATYSPLRAKSGLRPESSKQLDQFYSAIPQTVEHIARVCKQEIDLFGYAIPAR